MPRISKQSSKNESVIEGHGRHVTALSEHNSSGMRNRILKIALMQYSHHSLTSSLLVHEKAIKQNDEPCKLFLAGGGRIIHASKQKMVVLY